MKDLITQRYLKRIHLGEVSHAPTGVGSFSSGNVMIIGEQASNPSSAPEQQPFCCTNGCSGWINKLLELERIPEERLFWVNALNNDGTKTDLKKLTDQMKPKTVIALGGVAQTVCKEQGVEFEKFYHPQYWKRFRSKEQYALLERLKELTLPISDVRVAKKQQSIV